MVIDPIANLINGLKNASSQKKETFSISYSKMKHGILEVLKKSGYVADFEKKGKDVSKRLEVTLKYRENGDPMIGEARRISKFSRRIYKGVNDIYPVRDGYGILVLSTPKGIISGKEARKIKVGGEALFEIW